jgi:hypothetical protein
MSGNGPEDYRNHPAYDKFMRQTVNLFKGQIVSIQEQIAQQKQKVARAHQELFAAEWLRVSHANRRGDSFARVIAEQLKSLSKNPDVQSVEIRERYGQILVQTRSLSVIGVEPELVLGELYISIHFQGEYPGVKVLSDRYRSRGTPAPCVNEDGEVLNDNFKLAVPTLLGKFEYNQLLTMVCQVLRKLPGDFSPSQLQTWRDARERTA